MPDNREMNQSYRRHASLNAARPGNKRDLVVISDFGMDVAKLPVAGDLQLVGVEILLPAGAALMQSADQVLDGLNLGRQGDGHGFYVKHVRQGTEKKELCHIRVTYPRYIILLISISYFATCSRGVVIV